LNYLMDLVKVYRGTDLDHPPDGWVDIGELDANPEGDLVFSAGAPTATACDGVRHFSRKPPRKRRKTPPSLGRGACRGGIVLPGVVMGWS